jgi:hypothetical protein
MSQSILEKLQLKNEKNILIQGLPSSIEKLFNKVSFAKNLTPLLKARKIDFALVFAVSENQLNGILRDIMPALKEESKLWVATDLNRDGSWSVLTDAGYESIEQVSLDHVWHAANFGRPEVEEVYEMEVIQTKVSRKVKALSI